MTKRLKISKDCYMPTFSALRQYKSLKISKDCYSGVNAKRSKVADFFLFKQFPPLVSTDH